MVTVSTLKTAERTYHHGDLRSALIEAGLRHLETGGDQELSLRALAREAGVSPTAVYRHFPDKNALLSALAAAGVDQLGAWQQNAAEQASPDNAFAATGRAYVRWALAHPALFRLAFVQCHPMGDALFRDNTAARMLSDYAREITGDDAGAQRLMVQAWAVVHGLAMLMLDGQLPQDDALIDQVIDARTLFRA